MSILIGQNITAPLVLPAFFASQLNYPFTVVAQVKLAGFTSSGFHSRDVLRIDGPAGHFRTRITQNATAREMRARTDDGATGVDALLSVGAELENKWKIFVAGFNSAASRTVTSTDVDNAIISNENTGSRTVTGAVNLTLFDAAWGLGESRFARIGIYPQLLSPEQIQELRTTGQIAGVNPYVLWDTLADWGAGQIQDISGNARHIPPPAGWTYSADNPQIQPPAQITGPATLGSTASAAITISGQVTATAATLGGVTQTISGQAYDSELGVTTVTIDVVQGNLKFADYTLSVFLSAGDPLTSQASLVPPSGHQFVEITAPDTSEASVLHVSSGVEAEAGMQLEYVGLNFTIDETGIWSAEGESFPNQFLARPWRPGSETWGDWATITLYDAEAGLPVGPAPVIPADLRYITSSPMELKRLQRMSAGSRLANLGEVIAVAQRALLDLESRVDSLEV